ncbi:MAG TPA: dTDP-4-dehydrorhamnose reductase [Tepidisphaeraceae bacterium]|nr:dTDP-4-dehydrorhamnose reductase [Tepidisphaeraceae bacterium]
MALYDSILFTGGYGMLASAILRTLRQRGHEPTVTDRDTLDITDPASVRATFERARPTLLINCAAYTAVDKAEQQEAIANAINGTAVGYLGAACREFGTAMVHYSTDFVFDGKSTAPYKPTDEPAPLSAYGRSKLLGEQELQRHAPANWLILRTAWLYGANGPCFPATMVKVAKAGKPLKVVADQHGSPTYTFDLTDATLGLLDKGAASGIYHATNAGRTTWFDFTAAILEEFGLKTDLSPQLAADWKKLKPDAAERPGFSVMDVSATEQALGRPMRPWREALRAYRQEIEQNGGLV